MTIETWLCKKISTPLHQWLLDVFLLILIKTSTRINILHNSPFCVILEGFLVRPITEFRLDWGLDFDLAIPDFSISLFWAILCFCLYVLGHYHIENSTYGSASTFLLMLSHSFKALLVVMWNSSLPVVWNPPFVDCFTYCGMVDSLEMPLSPFLVCPN